MRTNPLLAASIDELSGQQNIRVVLSPQAMGSIRSFFAGICRICTPRETMVYMQESYAGASLYAWVERNVTLEHLALRGHHIYEIRRRVFDTSVTPHVVTMSELRHEEANTRVGPYLERASFHHYVLHEPVAEDPWREIFDTAGFIDLPPDGYPLSDTPVEAMRNIFMKRDPGSRKRQWAAHERILQLHEQAEERHARRVLDNEWLSGKDTR